VRARARARALIYTYIKYMFIYYITYSNIYCGSCRIDTRASDIEKKDNNHQQISKPPSSPVLSFKQTRQIEINNGLWGVQSSLEICHGDTRNGTLLSNLSRIDKRVKRYTLKLHWCVPHKWFGKAQQKKFFFKIR